MHPSAASDEHQRGKKGGWNVSETMGHCGRDESQPGKEVKDVSDYIGWICRETAFCMSNLKGFLC